MLTISEIAAGGCLTWYFTVVFISLLGTVQIFRHFTRQPPVPVSSSLELDLIPHVTIIRPCKGLEPCLTDCLASTFTQNYPHSRLTVYYCVSSRSDEAYPILAKLIEQHPEHDARIFVEEEDPRAADLGPNPKIRNLSRAYREAKGDLIWILDCNVWVNAGACARMVDKLCGFSIGAKGRSYHRPYKLVAHLPLCVSVDRTQYRPTLQRGVGGKWEKNGVGSHKQIVESQSDDHSILPVRTSPNSAHDHGFKTFFGGLLDQSFLSSAHAKFYVAINTVAIAPCINGKSSMFRRSHLDRLTSHAGSKLKGIDFFSENICEDHLIGDLLWKSYLPADATQYEPGGGQLQLELRKSNPAQLEFRNHGLALNDLAIQPIANMSLASYIARRIRWLRVRKFTVPAATLVEPGTESLVCSFVGALGATSSQVSKGAIGPSWSALLCVWLASVVCWCFVDYFVFSALQGCSSIEAIAPPGLRAAQDSMGAQPIRAQHNHDAEPEGPTSIQEDEAQKQSRGLVLPRFVDPAQYKRLDFWIWLSAYAVRELLALPIWLWAIWGGTTVTWREHKFWVGMDMKVHEIGLSSDALLEAAVSSNEEGVELDDSEVAHLPDFNDNQGGRGSGRGGYKGSWKTSLAQHSDRYVAVGMADRTTNLQDRSDSTLSTLRQRKQ